MAHTEAGDDFWHEEVEVPDDMDERDAAAFVVALEALLDRTRFMYRRLIEAAGALNLGDITVTRLTIDGRTVSRLPYRPADAAVIFIDTTMGDTVILPTPSAAHVVRLRTSVNPPTNGERITLVLPAAGADGLYFTVEREDGTDIAQLRGYTVTESGSNVHGTTSLTCVFEGGVWRGERPCGYVVPLAGF